MFLLKSVTKLPEYTGINNHPIKLIDNQQSPYEPIYNLGMVELVILKTYIKANLANGFIRPFKSSVGASILFVQKSDGSFRLCVNYQGLNDLNIKNWYLFPFISELLDWLG